jgi:hypothetical protein
MILCGTPGTAWWGARGRSLALNGRLGGQRGLNGGAGLDADQKNRIRTMLRINLAGEVAASRIYQGQRAIFPTASPTAKILEVCGAVPKVSTQRTRKENAPAGEGAPGHPHCLGK